MTLAGFRIRGFNTPGLKGGVLSVNSHLLGDVTFLKVAKLTRTTDERARKLRGHAAQSLRAKYHTPDSACKIRGRDSAFTSLHMGRFWRGIMAQSAQCQYGSRSHLLTAGPKRNRLRRYNAASALPPRSKPRAISPRRGRVRALRATGELPPWRRCRAICRILPTCRFVSLKWRPQTIPDTRLSISSRCNFHCCLNGGLPTRR